jgi:hypothetical protein
MSLVYACVHSSGGQWKPDHDRTQLRRPTMDIDGFI